MGNTVVCLQGWDYDYGDYDYGDYEYDESDYDYRSLESPRR